MSFDHSKPSKGEHKSWDRDLPSVLLDGEQVSESQLHNLISGNEELIKSFKNRGLGQHGAIAILEKHIKQAKMKLLIGAHR